MREGEVVVRGYRELLRACDHAGEETKTAVRGAFRLVGEAVRSDASARFAPYDGRTAAGYRTRVRQSGVVVSQSLRKTTGTRPDYGGLQMRKALLPALGHESRETELALERALDRVCDHFERTP
jgi:hypothetical protein